MEQKILFIAGMHRSGTSMLANWIQLIGINLGEALLEANRFNPKGYYEDKEIVKIMENQLVKLHLDSTGTKLSGKIKELKFLLEIKIKIKDWLDKRKNLPQWGWKEPRSTLFLQEWKQIMPNLVCIAIYRHFANVIESLERRNYHSLFWTQNFSSFKSWLYIFFYFFYVKRLRELYLNAWISYNEEILKFKKQFKSDCLILEAEKILNEDRKIYEWLVSKGFKIDYVNIDAVYEKSLLHKNRLYLWGINKGLKQKAQSILNELYEKSVHNNSY